MPYKIIIKIILNFSGLLLLVSSCIMSSMLPSAPLIEEKGQVVTDVGFYGFMPGLQTSIAYGLTDKIAIQTEAAVAQSSFHFQQSIGLYGKNNKGIKCELYGGYLYGKYNTDFWDRELLEYGTYSIYYLRYNYGRKWKRFPEVISGMSFMPGYIHNDKYNTYFYSPYNIHYLNTGLFYAHQFFFKFDYSRVRLGLNTQFSGYYNYRNKTSEFNNITFGLSFQYKHCTDPNLCPRLFKQKDKYNHFGTFKLSFSNPYITLDDKYYGGAPDNIQIKHNLFPVAVSYNQQIFNWFSVGIGAYAYKIHGKVQGSLYTSDYSFKFSDTEFFIKTLVNYKLTKKWDLYAGIYLNYVKIKTDVVFDDPLKSIKVLDKRMRKFYGGLVPLGISYFIKNKYGLNLEMFWSDKTIFSASLLYRI